MQHGQSTGATVAAVSSPARRPLAGAASVDRATDEADRVKDQAGRITDDADLVALGEARAETVGVVSTSGSALEDRRDREGGRWTRDWRSWPRAALDGLNRWRTTAGAFDTAVCVAFLGFAAWLSHNLWPDPATRALADNVNDQALIEWFLAHAVRVWKGDFSLLTDRLNSPDGVNLMSNASHILHGVLMAPVTVLFGPAASFALLVAFNLAATAAGWYLLFARGLRLHRGAAIVGGLSAGFAPGMISQSNSHLHMTAQWLIPPIVWCVIRLTRVRGQRDAVKTALGLSALVCAQLLLGEEVLFLAVMTLVLFAVVYAVLRLRWALRVAPTFLAGMAIAAGVSTIVLVYPLWYQFAGPRHTPNAPFPPQYYFADLASYFVFSPLSLAGSDDASRLASSDTELNAFFGLPLLVVLLGCALWRWRSPTVVAATVTSVVIMYLSLGVNVTLDGEKTGWPSLYKTIADIPVVNGALPTRYSLAVITLIAVVLANTIDAAIRTRGVSRVAVPAAIVAALLPLAPMPLQTTYRAPVPEFITTGAWRQCAPEDGVIVPVPLPTPTAPDSMRWAAAADTAFGLPEGFFIGNYGPGGRASVGTYKRPTSKLLADVASTGAIPDISDATRTQARADLAFWRADCVALAHGPNEGALRTTLERLLGPGTAIADTWTWKISR